MSAAEPPRFTLADARALLERTPRVLDAWLRDLPEAWLAADEGPGTWSPHLVLGHLVHGERTDWMARARRILEHGEGLAFEPFDRFAQLAAPPRATGELLDDFARERARSLRELDGLRLVEADLGRRGLHPDFGPVTLGQLLSTWVVHDQGHLAQIARVLAKRYRADVGPWSAYLPVLTRPV
jgi:hypothetical protein